MYSNVQDLGIYKMSKIESEIIILRARELIVHLKIHRHTLAALLKEGLPSLKIGHQRRYDLNAALLWLAAR